MGSGNGTVHARYGWVCNFTEISLKFQPLLSDCAQFASHSLVPRRQITVPTRELRYRLLRGAGGREAVRIALAHARKQIGWCDIRATYRDARVGACTRKSVIDAHSLIIVCCKCPDIIAHCSLAASPRRCTNVTASWAISVFINHAGMMPPAFTCWVNVKLVTPGWFATGWTRCMPRRILART